MGSVKYGVGADSIWNLANETKKNMFFTSDSLMHSGLK